MTYTITLHDRKPAFDLSQMPEMRGDPGAREGNWRQGEYIMRPSWTKHDVIADGSAKSRENAVSSGRLLSLCCGSQRLISCSLWRKGMSVHLSCAICFERITLNIFKSVTLTPIFSISMISSSKTLGNQYQAKKIRIVQHLRVVALRLRRGHFLNSKCKSFLFQATSHNNLVPI